MTAAPGNPPNFGVPPIQATPAEIEAARKQQDARKALDKFLNRESEFLYDTEVEEVEMEQSEQIPFAFQMDLPARTFEFFRNGIGASTPAYPQGKTPAETNLPRDGGIPKGERWLITDIGFNLSFVIPPTNAVFFIEDAVPAPVGFDISSFNSFEGYLKAQLANFVLGASYITYNKQTIERVLGNPVFHPAGFGLDMPMSLNLNNGRPSMEARRSLKSPIILEAQDSFIFRLVRPRLQQFIFPFKFDDAAIPEEVAKQKVYAFYKLALYGYHDNVIPQ